MPSLSHILLSSKPLKQLGLGCLMTLSILGVAHAEKAVPDSKVEFKNSLPVTLEEIAVVDVLGQICPPLLGKNNNFDRGYLQVLTELLPNFPDPILALKALQDDPEYQEKLKEARGDAGKVSVDENREVCLDVAQYQAEPQKNKK
jgi:hypothetical protein